MRNLRYTFYTLVMKLLPIGPIRPIQERILETMRGEVEQKRRELQQVRWQANQAHMELQSDLENPDYPPEKKEELRKIDRQLCELLDDYVLISRYRIPDD